MGNAWTKEQQQVIDLRGCDMLVSAAAGSGKTAVLVERIISRIMDQKEPVDIDRLLVVTFTNAAASEMRERILAALEEQLEQCPDSIHLQRQTALVHHAKITTIHSFCLDVIRNHFHMISLDPGFRIGDEGELKLLRHEVMEKLLEEEYQQADPGFLRFLEAFAPGKSDQGIEELLLQLYDFSMSYPFPGEWRQNCGQIYGMEDPGDLEETAWMKILKRKIHLKENDLEELVKEALETAGEPDGPKMYEETLLQDLAKIRQLKDCRSYEDCYRVFADDTGFGALSRKRDPAVSAPKREQVKNLRDQVKKDWKKLEEDYFSVPLQQMLQSMKRTHGMIQMLLKLTDRFQELYEAAKTEKNIVDFNDLEHFALQILLSREGENWVPSAAAKEYSEQFQEIMIDEYQDSNLVQEILLTSVCGSQQKEHKLFMVGDVKQSIYRFRLAKPELFMEKMKTYQKAEGVQRRIDLHKNFRSRHQVLEGINLIFRQIMTYSVGGVEYDEDAALYPGALFEPKQEETKKEEFSEPELLLVVPETAGFRPQEEALGEDVSEESDREAREQEAEAAGLRIRQIVGKETVWDKEQKCYRPIRYSDVVILLRTVSGWAQTFSQVLGELGIPSYTGGGTGYFSTPEIRTILAFLKVLDNPRQDIPLAAALRSPIGSMTDEELAQLRIGSPDTDLYTCCCRYLERQEEDDQGLRKLRRFWAMLKKLRGLVPSIPVHQLLWKVLDETGYGEYASAMPGGLQRRANLEMLVEKAVDYEATSYRGLFHFVRYIEQLQKYEIDYGEAGIGGEAADTVRIMSIHKSKGLEFPVVFVCGMGKQFNRQDSRSQLVLHPELGIGCDEIDPEQRVRLPLLVKKVIAGQLQEENLGEELRVLYVAMTRAREKLILMGTVTDPGKQIEKWYLEGKRKGEKLSYSVISGASCYLDWVLPALLRHRSGEILLQNLDVSADRQNGIYDADGNFQVRILYPEKQRNQREEHCRYLENTKKELKELQEDQTYDPEVQKQIGILFGERQTKENGREIPGKMTVSQLKSRGKSRETEDDVPRYEEPSIVPLIPRFKSGEEETTGAARGTIYHRFLEHLDFNGTFDRKFTETQLATMVKCGKIRKDESEWISESKITRFLNSEIAGRMQQAAGRGELFREQPFVLGISADQIDETWDEKEEVLIQGIIDVWFYEGEEIVLLDYKTDFVPEGRGGDFLTNRYAQQLYYYQLALERLTGKKVKEKVIYSFCLEQSLKVE